ncbi:hypothetical protein [Mucilaginibacter sp. KACC 22063]|uniref:hypothetical protein n=1 Tax=Mucilaginibacter sp. KACC 22063 TaxID=3025666 RepID=UPI00236622E5|nr:hypothetical protein [Mucilaginibacter sp. KACC 22063]WDF56873.1 hypothetical protein PQ461_07370 [Mucilaginibacter sp. KACC 22063]
MNQIPLDHGLIYTETNLNHFFPEPWNMVTSAFFLIPAFYWLIKLKGFSREYVFLSLATWLLLIGCIGSTVYHGLRRWHIFIFMDWVPIALLCLMASVYFWMKVLGKWVYGFLALLIFIGMEFAVRKLFTGYDVQLMISLNYGMMVLMILLPLILLLVKLKGHNAWLVITALLAFGAALFFRVADRWAILPMGTHFLWHTFGSIATSLMFVFIYRLYSVK